jgi:hypothetical protein
MNESWYILLTDFAWVMYLLSSCISWFTFMLFIWWWAQTRTASEIYKYFTFMIAANAISDMTALYSRTLIFINHEAYMSFVQTWIWNIRRVPEMMIMSIIGLRMIGRIIQTLKAVEDIQNEKAPAPGNPVDAPSPDTSAGSNVGSD